MHSEVEPRNEYVNRTIETIVLHSTEQVRQVSTSVANLKVQLLSENRLIRPAETNTKRCHDRLAAHESWAQLDESKIDFQPELEPYKAEMESRQKALDELKARIAQSNAAAKEKQPETAAKSAELPK